MKAFPIFCALLVGSFLGAEQAIAEPVNSLNCSGVERQLFCAKESADDHECVPISDEIEGYVRRLIAILESSPRIIQHTACELDRVNILLTREGMPQGSIAFSNGNQIFIPKEVFQRSDASMERVLRNLKGLYTFSDGVTPFAEVDDLEIEYEAAIENELFNDYYLARILFHEVGHVIENNRLVTAPYSCLGNLRHGRRLASLSRLPIDPSPSDTRCQALLAIRQDIDTYADFRRSEFISPYALCSESEDFAELFSELLIYDSIGFNYSLSDGQNTLFRLDDFLKNDAVRGKVNTIRALSNPRLWEAVEPSKIYYDHLLCIGDFSDLDLAQNP